MRRYICEFGFGSLLFAALGLLSLAVVVLPTTPAFAASENNCAKQSNGDCTGDCPKDTPNCHVTSQNGCRCEA